MRNGHVNNKILLKIEELVKPLSKLPKTWNDHLAKHLDEYMGCIEELSRDDSLGLTAINFIEAGLMVENTSKLYALNVDYLWQFMTQVLEVLRMNKSANNNKRRSETSVETTDSSEEGSRTRKKRAVFEEFEEIIPHIIDPDMKTEERNEPIKPLPLQRHLMAKTDWKRRKHSCRIFDVDGDTVVPTDYSVMLQTSGQGKLQLNMLREIISECSEAEHTERESLVELIHVLELLIQELSQSNASCSTTDGGDSDLAEETELTPDVILNTPTLGALTEHESVEPPEHPALSSLPVTPPPSPEPIKRSASVVETPEGIKRSISDAESEKEVCAAGLSARRRGKKEHIVTVPCDPWKPEQGVRERPLRRKQTFKLPCDPKLLKSFEKKRKSGHEEKVKLMVEYNGTKMLCTYMIHSRFPFCPDFKKFCLWEIKQKSLLLGNQPKLCSVRGLEELHHLSKEHDEDFFGFEDYEPEFVEEEGFRGFPEVEEGDKGVDNENDAADPDSTTAPLLMDESHENETHPACSKDHSFENNVFSQTKSSADVSHEHMEAEIARQVAEWEKYIHPKLKVAHDRGHFDIHKVGTEILRSFPQSSAKVTLQFKHFAADKPRADIPRYFLAALQLANTNNIEISQSASGHLSMDCMEMTLLSPVRHHKALEDYKAPSQDGRRKRFISRTGICDSDSDGDGDGTASSSTCKHKRNKR